MRGLKLFFGVVVLLMLLVTTWASLHENVIAAVLRLVRDPWGLATLADAYFAFLTFWLWLAWKEAHWASSLGWLVAILLLGNFAMAAYVLLQLRQDRDVASLLGRRKGVTS